MSDLENRTFTSDDLLKLKEIISQGIKIHQQVDDLREGLKETVKEVANVLNVKPKLINSAIRTAYKENLEEKKADVEDLEEILHISGIK